MKRNLFLRTDILPEEIPVLFNNRNVYYPFTESKMREIILRDSQLLKTVTVPYYFYIPKNSAANNAKRKMSLLHPIAQIQSFNYILRYEQLILSYCSKSPYSVRSPAKRNPIKFNNIHAKELTSNKLVEEFSFTKETAITSEENKILFFNYFSYKKYKRIDELYKSPKFKRAKYKYQYFSNLDIQNFFPSIYTHSLSWAILGDKAIAKAKDNIKNSDLFANATDIIVQKINFNETHGLVVGPEFSRIIAELLLTRVDINLNIRLSKKGINNNSDYLIYRYVDDYLIFSMDESIAKEIESDLRDELLKFNLSINLSKSKVQKRPFKIYSTPIVELKRALKEFEYEKMLIKNNSKIEGPIIGYQATWNDMLEKIEKIINENPDSSKRVVNYFLKTMLTSIELNHSHRGSMLNLIDIISNVYSLDINYRSTMYLVSIYAKVHNNSKIELAKLNELLAEKKGVIDKETQVISSNIKNIQIINESIFRNATTLLKNNFSKIETMHELIVFMKTLEKALSAQLLCKIIEAFPGNYFVICSIAYYILNDDLNNLNQQYKTVESKLMRSIDNHIYNYQSKGALDNLFESEYFYFINDFSFYPGFPSQKQKQYRFLIDSTCTKLIKNVWKASDINSLEYKNREYIWKMVTKRSYYDWHAKTEDFVRKVVKKSSNLYRLDSNSDY